jgi:hypothetical protein
MQGPVNEYHWTVCVRWEDRGASGRGTSRGSRFESKGHPCAYVYFVRHTREPTRPCVALLPRTVVVIVHACVATHALPPSARDEYAPPRLLRPIHTEKKNASHRKKTCSTPRVHEKQTKIQLSYERACIHAVLSCPLPPQHTHPTPPLTRTVDIYTHTHVPMSCCARSCCSIVCCARSLSSICS